MAKNKKPAQKAVQPNTLEAELGLDVAALETTVESVEPIEVTEVIEVGVTEESTQGELFADITEIEEGDFPAETDEIDEDIEAVSTKAGTEDVLDSYGNVLYRRMTKKTEVASAKKEPRKSETKTRIRMTGVPGATNSNPVNLSFPADRWGLTKDVKQAIIYAASRISGDQRKKDLFDEIVGTLLDHVEAKFAHDNKRRFLEGA